VERPVYAQCWFPRSHCYHPSLPPRRLKMVEDFAAYRATMLTWPMLGGGGISLPYLEAEAHEPVTPRYRQYGFLNDAEFITECRARGVAPFSVIFCLQGWEFPAELSEGEDEVLAMNELRGAGKRTWLGLREFTQNTYPKIWKPFEHYFPDGLTNSAGQPVTDLWEECTSRDLAGNPIHADWLECPDREHACYLMDSNNPVWREYLKAIIRIQIDAGVDGIQFDEPDGPIAALRYGGCFCRDCMTGFRRYLNGLPAGQLPAEVAALLPDLDYGDYLRERGQTRIDPVNPDWLTVAYGQFLRRCTAANLRDVIGYARSYARAAGREVRLSANLFEGLPCFAPLVADLDVMVPEQRHNLYRQPSWMRYIAGFAAAKPVAISVNPYGGVLPELAIALREGHGVDHFLGMLYEAAAMGANLSVPYGAWMGSVIEDAFYAPHEVTVAVQDFLADHEFLYGSAAPADRAATANEIAVAYSVDSEFVRVTFGNLAVGEARSGPPASAWTTVTDFTTVIEGLSDDRQPYDVVMFYDGDLAPDTVSSQALARYRCLVLAGCTALTASQARAVRGYLDGGGQVVVVGQLGVAGAVGDARDAAAAIAGHELARTLTAADFLAWIGRDPQVRLDGDAAARPAVNLQVTAAGTAALHIVRYAPPDVRGGPLAQTAGPVPVTVRLPYPASAAVYHAPGQPSQPLAVATEGTTARLTLPPIGPYAIVDFLP
jgi:hypothetical protein